MRLLLEVAPEHAGELEAAGEFVNTFCAMVNRYKAEGKVITITLSPGEPPLELTGAWSSPACMCCVDNECECAGKDLA